MCQNHTWFIHQLTVLLLIGPPPDQGPRRTIRQASTLFNDGTTPTAAYFPLQKPKREQSKSVLPRTVQTLLYCTRKLARSQAPEKDLIRSTKFHARDSRDISAASSPPRRSVAEQSGEKVRNFPLQRRIQISASASLLFYLQSQAFLYEMRKPHQPHSRRKWLLPLFFVSLISSSLVLLSVLHYGNRSPPSFLSDSSSDGARHFPKPPRLAYLISGTKGDGPRLRRVLQAVYHPWNYYLLHLDLEALQAERMELGRYVKTEPVFAAFDNVRVVGNANLVTYKGPTMIACTLHAVAVLLRTAKEWDWFINLSASDYPLMSQDGWFFRLKGVSLFRFQCCGRCAGLMLDGFELACVSDSKIRLSKHNHSLCFEYSAFNHVLQSQNVNKLSHWVMRRVSDNCDCECLFLIKIRGYFSLREIINFVYVGKCSSVSSLNIGVMMLLSFALRFV
ncbi:hypothetical protein ACLOJK_012885 [Asimina triloba]